MSCCVNQTINYGEFHIKGLTGSTSTIQLTSDLTVKKLKKIVKERLLGEGTELAQLVINGKPMKSGKVINAGVINGSTVLVIAKLNTNRPAPPSCCIIL